MTELSEIKRRLTSLELDVAIVKAMADGLNMRLSDLEDRVTENGG